MIRWEEEDETYRLTWPRGCLSENPTCEDDEGGGEDGGDEERDAGEEKCLDKRVDQIITFWRLDQISQITAEEIDQVRYNIISGEQSVT